MLLAELTAGETSNDGSGESDAETLGSRVKVLIQLAFDALATIPISRPRAGARV